MKQEKQGLKLFFSVICFSNTYCNTLTFCRLFVHTRLIIHKPFKTIDSVLLYFSITANVCTFIHLNKVFEKNICLCKEEQLKILAQIEIHTDRQRDKLIFIGRIPFFFLDTNSYESSNILQILF